MRFRAFALFVISAALVAAPHPAKAATPAPAVQAVAPAQVEVGNVLVVRGKNFSPTRSRNTVVFRGTRNTVSAKPFASSTRRLFVRVPGRAQFLLGLQDGKRIPTRLGLRVLTRGKASTGASRSVVVLPQPGPVITSGPDGSTTDRSASFEFSSAKAVSYTCRLDAGAWEACTSPASYSDLDLGGHQFSVRAHDRAGNTYASTTTQSWTIVAPPGPDVEISFGPEASTDSNSAVFVFSSDQEGTFECAIDLEAYSACTSPKSYSSLEPGAHEFRVRVTNANGTDVATRNWVVNEPPAESEPVDVAVEGTSADGLTFEGSTTGTPEPSDFETFEATLSHDALNGSGDCVPASGDWSYFDADGDLAAEFTQDSYGLYCPESDSYSFYWRQVGGGENDTGSFTLVYDSVDGTFTSQQNGRYTP